MSQCFAVSEYLQQREAQSRYMDNEYPGTEEDYRSDINRSGTVYVGSLNPATREEQIHLLFSVCGKVKRVIMGLDRYEYVPCGFCFVEYWNSGDSKVAKGYLNGYKLDGSMLKVDLDYGFFEGRQFGRGKHGGQLKKDFETMSKKRRVF